MAEVVLMPKVGISVESCIITEWRKKPGDAIAVGDILFDYETDKSSLECESTAAGTLLEQFFANGDEAPVLTPVCAIGEAGEDVSALRPGGAGAAPPPPPAQPAAEETAPTQQAPTAAAAQSLAAAPTDGTIKISPRARHLAEKQNVNPAFATPTGPYGRIIERDIRAALAQGVGVGTGAVGAAASTGGTGIGGRSSAADAAAQPATPITTLPAAEGPEYEDVRYTGIRKAISASMTASLRDIPQLTHNFSFDAGELLRYRAKLKEHAESMGLPSITLNDLILYAVSRLLPKYPELNAHMLDGNTIRKFRDVNLGVAVDTPRGLMVPKIKAANRKSLAQIAGETKDLAKQAQEGHISPDLLAGGTFTVSNLGSFGVESFTPVINPPETGILGVDNIVKRPRARADGGIELYPAMGLSVTYDHRAIDGAPLSRFGSELCRMLENFPLALAL